MDDATTSTVTTAATARRVTLSPDTNASRRGRTEEGDEVPVQRSTKRLRFGDPGLRKLRDALQDENADIAAAAIDPLVKLLKSMEDADDKRLLGFYKTGGHRDIICAMARHKNSEQFQGKALQGLSNLSGSEPTGFSLLEAGALEGAFNAARNFPTNQDLASYTIDLVHFNCVTSNEDDEDARYGNMKRFIKWGVFLDCIDIAKKFPVDLDVGKSMLDLFERVYGATSVDLRPIMEDSLAGISKAMKHFPNDTDLRTRACEVVDLAAKHPDARRRMFEKAGVLVVLAHICERYWSCPSGSEKRLLYRRARDALESMFAKN